MKVECLFSNDGGQLRHGRSHSQSVIGLGTRSRLNSVDHDPSRTSMYVSADEQLITVTESDGNYLYGSSAVADELNATDTAVWNVNRSSSMLIKQQSIDSGVYGTKDSFLAGGQGLGIGQGLQGHSTATGGAREAEADAHDGSSSLAPLQERVFIKVKPSALQKECSAEVSVEGKSTHSLAGEEEGRVLGPIGASKGKGGEDSERKVTDMEVDSDDGRGSSNGQAERAEVRQPAEPVTTGISGTAGTTGSGSKGKGAGVRLESGLVDYCVVLGPSEPFALMEPSHYVTPDGRLAQIPFSAFDSPVVLGDAGAVADSPYPPSSLAGAGAGLFSESGTCTQSGAVWSALSEEQEVVVWDRLPREDHHDVELPSKVRGEILSN